MTTRTPDSVWWSRLATEGLTDMLEFEPDPACEIPHVRGLPVPIDRPSGTVFVREWPNIAGRLEPVEDGDLVRWDRSLAAKPPVGTIISHGASADPTLLTTVNAWFSKFVRSLEQTPGVVRASPSETPRAIILTPWPHEDLRSLPDGIIPVSRGLAEYPGGIILTMRPKQWEHKSAYAEQIQGWLESMAIHSSIR